MTLQDFYKGKRVLITGHTGFKGAWLSLLLQSFQADVFGFSLPAVSNSLFCSLQNSGHNFFRPSSEILGDISDLNLISQYIYDVSPDIIFHLAAQPLVRESYVNPLGTWNTNVIGTLHLMESLKNISHLCSVVCVTTDKVYQNREWDFGYRECDELGGLDPYSSSKAASELAINSWRNSFVGKEAHQKSNLMIASARAGNVIGGGDYSKDRLIPDIVHSIVNSKNISIRNPNSTRPWQHVLDPLIGYLTLAKALYVSPSNNTLQTPFNFGPSISSNRSVTEVIDLFAKQWPYKIPTSYAASSFHESHLLNLSSDKAYHLLKWQPKWDFDQAISRTVRWYKLCYAGKSSYQLCMADINEYFSV